MGDLYKPDVIAVTEAVSKLIQRLQESGVADVRISSDVDELEAVVGYLGKGAVGEHLSVARNTLPPGQVFWAGAYDNEGRCIATIACRKDDIEGWDLADYISRFWRQMYVSLDNKPVEFKPGSLDFVKGITGPIAYFGEAFTHVDWRKKGVLPTLHKLLVVQAYFHFRPVHIYGWMARAIMKNAVDWGYRTVFPIKDCWTRPPVNRALYDICYVGMDCPRDVLSILQNPTEHVVS